MTGAESPVTVSGRHLGLQFPPTIERLRELGPQFLTQAFRATGRLSSNNAVAEIVRGEEFFGGGAGRKLRLELRYERDEPGLDTALFAKFPRDFGDPLRALFSPLMEPEVQFALISRRPDFPIAVPRCYFADYDPDTSTGLLITQTIAYGRQGIRPHQDKCLDDELADPMAYYSALVRAVARLSGFHKSGRFGAEADKQFPYDPEYIRPTDRIPYTRETLRDKLGYLGRFAQRYPWVFPVEFTSGAFLAELIEGAQGILDAETDIKHFLNGRHDFVALSHWNANIDNAWFWESADGQLEAGLLDWGSVGRMNIAQAFYGIMCACSIDFWNARKSELLRLFADEYQRNGGPRIDIDELDFHVRLYVAMLGLAWMIDAPAIIESQLPELHDIHSHEDPRFKGHFLVRTQRQLLAVFLNAWNVERLGELSLEFERRRV